MTDTRPRCVHCYLPLWDGYVPVHDLHHSRTMSGANLVMGLRMRVLKEAVIDSLGGRGWMLRVMSALGRMIR